MEILTSIKNVSKVIFKLTLDWATNDGRGYETLLFNNKEDALKEFEAQLKIIKTDKSSWEYEVLKEATDEHDYDEVFAPRYLTGEYDYMSRFTQDFNHLINHPNRDILLKSFVLYQNNYEDNEHTYLSLRAVCILEH